MTHCFIREETAINIAVACQLLWTEAKMHRTVINLRGTGESETDEIKQALEGKTRTTKTLPYFHSSSFFSSSSSGGCL